MCCGETKSEETKAVCKPVVHCATRGGLVTKPAADNTRAEHIRNKTPPTLLTKSGRRPPSCSFWFLVESSVSCFFLSLPALSRIFFAVEIKCAIASVGTGQLHNVSHVILFGVRCSRTLGGGYGGFRWHNFLAVVFPPAPNSMWSVLRCSL